MKRENLVRRYVREYAEDAKRGVPADKADRIDRAVRAVQRGMITNLEAVRVIARIETE